MSYASSLPKYLVIAATIGGIFIITKNLIRDTDDQPMVKVEVPKLSTDAIRGKQLFNDNCSACHGKNAAGSNSGPPLIHPIYEPNHHADVSFQLAAKRGVRAHHWPFGNMPPQPQVKPSDVSAIILYVRELQRANGIN